MAVLIKGMEMPEDCEVCSFAVFYHDCVAVPGGYYRRITDEEYDAGSRPDWCPLVEVPKLSKLDAEQLRILEEAGLE